jgi:phosphoribosylformylglycinamidine synthase
MGASIAVAEAARNLVCSGAEPIGLTDCLNFGSPERPDIMWQFVLCVEGIRDACEALSIPVVSGNVSFYNETNGLAVYPTPIIGMVGLIEPAEQATSQWFKEAGDAIILLGDTKEDLGGTEYLRVVHGREQGSPPLLDLEKEKALQTCVLQLVRAGLVRSAHDCSDGGLAVALAECCVTSPSQHLLGAVIRLTSGGLRRDALLFGESQSRVILSVRPADRDEVLRTAGALHVPAEVIGTVGGDRLTIDVADEAGKGPYRIDASVDQLYGTWAHSLEKTLGAPVAPRNATGPRGEA